jgi:predicted ATPase
LCCGATPASALGAAAGAHLAVVEQLARPVAARLGLGLEREHRAMSLDALADGVVQLLLASSAPCVVILADLHWMDTRSLELLELVLERCAGLQCERPIRLAFVLSSRQECSGPLRAARERLRNARVLHEVALPPLQAHEVGELVGAMLGASDISPSLVRALTDATRGEALLVGEILRAWVNDGRLCPRAAGWTFRALPDSGAIEIEIERLYCDRLRELATIQLQALGVLAIFGRPIAFRRLSAVLEVNADSTLEAVAELRRRNLVFLSHDELVHISTERLSDAAHAMLEPDRRTALHLRLGDVLVDAGDAAQAAFHYQRGANLSAAAAQYGRAAEQCYERGALSQALEYAEKSAACGASGAALGRLCSMAAEAARLCGDRRAASFAERALSLLPLGSSGWLRASRVAIAMFNPLVKVP